MYVDFLDELGSGVAPLSAADIRDDLGVAYGGIALILLVAPLLLSMLVEGPLLLLSDRWRRDRVAAICVGLMGVFMVSAACARSAWLLALAFGAWGSAGGLGCGLSQALLMDAHPDARERWMTRWTLMGALGDMATPLLILGVASLGWGWRAGLGLAGGLHLVHAVVLARVRMQPVSACEPEGAEPAERPLLERLRAGLRDRELLMWLGACSLCCLLDEILVAFGVLFLRDELGAPIETQAIAFAACGVGGVLGLAVTEWLLRRVDGLRLLVVSSIACVVVYVLWLQLHTIPVSLVALFLVGVCVAPLYPICAARAYAARPGQAGLVAAIDQLFAPVSLLAPLLIGLVADGIGIVVALALLLLQPVGVGLVAVVGLWRQRGGGRA
ncbi:MFS transporter [Enhygromyxa salina]|uniref:Major Facilitator Superfamily protein n=1 Tax=Enhygromyxa salina TaxID=215803 RepID=A0A2S9YJ37_9BACT|nr:MFS transporter [Enhygromyxa salina]PRQ05115.1 Major Facilitator Superfamily protein [Enhygromyxa salina]